MKNRLTLSLLAAAALVALARAAEPAAADGSERLRAALRDTTTQLRNAQSDLANLQSQQAGLAEEKKALAEKYEALKKQAGTERTALDKNLATLTAQAADQKAQIARLTEALAKAKAENDRLAVLAKNSDAQGARLAEENLVLQRRLADRESKNLALFLLGNEVLTRYEEFSLGNALRAKEPFVGTTRTKLENLVQDYQDKLADNRVRP